MSKSVLVISAILAALFATPAVAMTPSIWLGVSATQNDGVDKPILGITAQVEQFTGQWEWTGQAGWAHREKNVPGDGHLWQARATAQRWFGQVAPGVGVETARQVTSAWEKKETKGIALVAVRLGRMEVTPEYRWPLSSEDDAGGVESFGAAVEVPVTGRWWVRGEYREADFGDGTNGSSVGAAIGWRR